MSIQSMYLSSKGISSLLDGETSSIADLEIQHSQHYHIVCIIKPNTVVAYKRSFRDCSP